METKVRKVDCNKRSPKMPGDYQTDIGLVGYNGNGNWVTSGSLGVPKYWYEKYTPKPRKKKKQ